jgi:hypothetical protein
LIILAFNVYRSIFSIDSKIEDVKEQIKLKKEEIYFNKLYFSKFLDSEWAKVIYAHTNGIPLEGEKVFLIKNYTNSVKLSQSKKSQQITNISNFNIWKQLLVRKFMKVLDN